jgi:hypothetical protein
MDLLVGVDLGTTACKVTVVNSDLTATSISSPPTRLLHGIVDGLNKIRTPGRGCRYDGAACAGQRGCRFA